MRLVVGGRNTPAIRKACCAQGNRLSRQSCVLVCCGAIIQHSFGSPAIHYSRQWSVVSGQYTALSSPCHRLLITGHCVGTGGFASLPYGRVAFVENVNDLREFTELRTVCRKCT